MLTRRLPRVLVSGFLLAVTVSGLTACRTSPNVAAYVGDETVTVSELEAAVADRLEEEAVAEWAAGREDEFTRLVLELLVQEEVHAAAAERYGVSVADAAVRRRVAEVIGDRDADMLYEQAAAAQGVGREDVFESIRQQMVRREIAEVEGLTEAPTDAELQARYEEVRESLAEVSFGYITVPDQTTADAVLAQLTANPGTYPALAAQYAGTYTLPELETRAPQDVPPPLVEGVSSADPQTGFTLALPEAGGVIVGFVADVIYPEFEELRPQIEEEAARQADAAGGELVTEVREDLGVTINPRYGELEEGQIVPVEGGVVDILGDEPTGEDGAGAAPPGE